MLHLPQNFSWNLMIHSLLNSFKARDMKEQFFCIQPFQAYLWCQSSLPKHQWKQLSPAMKIMHSYISALRNLHWKCPGLICFPWAQLNSQLSAQFIWALMDQNQQCDSHLSALVDHTANPEWVWCGPQDKLRGVDRQLCSAQAKVSKSCWGVVPCQLSTNTPKWGKQKHR